MLSKLFDKIKKPEAPTAGPVESIVVGLGNPGKQYEHTRHNIGFLAVDAIAQKRGFKVDRLKFKSLCGECDLGGKRVLFLKPGTYMNLSGQAVLEAMQFYKIPIENVVVISDDTALDVGVVRIRRKGSDGGHNGLKNIIYLTGKDTFPRIRVGVGKKPHPDYDLADWVLGRFSDSDMKAMKPMFDHVDEMVELIVSGDIDEAMGRFNG